MVDEKQSGIIGDFMSGVGVDHRGRNINTVHELNDVEVEQTHDFIQWLFPLDESSNAVPSAPVLSQADIEVIRSNVIAQSNMKHSATWFLGFLARNDQWRTRYNHNHLRITRALKSLRLLTGDNDADEFKTAIFELLGDDLHLIDSKAVEFWKGA